MMCYPFTFIVSHQIGQNLYNIHPRSMYPKNIYLEEYVGKNTPTFFLNNNDIYIHLYHGVTIYI